MNLIKRNNYLPENIKELTKFVLIGREKLTAVKAQIRAIDKLELATGVREQKRDEAQMLAGALLDAETKLGDMLSDGYSSRTIGGKEGGSKKSLPVGITKQHETSVIKGRWKRI